MYNAHYVIVFQNQMNGHHKFKGFVLIVNKIYTLKIKVKQDDYDTQIVSLNGKKVDELTDTFLWKIVDMHRHNFVNYPEEKPTIEGALSEIVERIPNAKDLHDL